MSFGENLKRLRKKAGMTQAEFADILGMTDSNYSRYEKEKAQPPLNVLLSMTQALGISANELIGYNEVDIYMNELHRLKFNVERDNAGYIIITSYPQIEYPDNLTFNKINIRLSEQEFKNRMSNVFHSFEDISIFYLQIMFFQSLLIQPLLDKQKK